MKSFKESAIQILQNSGSPLHYKEITERAIKEGLISSEGKTPWATMNAQLSVDVVKNGDNSPFIRTDPGYFYLRTLKVSLSDKVGIKDTVKARIFRHNINESLSTKQKGDITEARVAELITLYGDEGLSCYRPISDDEGIDIIVKKRGELDVVYVQVKSTYGYNDSRGFVSTVKEKSIQDKTRMLIVFVYFDLSTGDLYDHIFCIPAPEFLKLTANDKKKTGHRVFTVGLNNPDKSKYAEFMIEKRELANKIVEIMGRLCV